MIFRPRPRVPADRWGALNRTYPPTSGVPGPRNPNLTPYAIPFARAVEGGAARRVVLVCGAQMGKTESFLDVIGSRLDQRPVPILYAGPSEKFVAEQFEPRLMALLDEAPVLKAKVARGKAMKKARKVIAGVPVRLAHAGSSTALKSDPAGLALVDEYDEMLANIHGQGDPLGLIEARGFTYADFSVGITSTPSRGAVETDRDEETGLEFWKWANPEDIESSIWRLWQEGTRHHWAWSCPHCRAWFIPRFSLLRWPDKATPSRARREAWIECRSCGGVIGERHKAEMNEGGVYVAPGQRIEEDGTVVGDPPDSSTLSFWVSGLASPFVTFGERAETWLKAFASGEADKQQTAINAGFGEVFVPSGGDLPSAAEVLRLRTPDYRMGEVPDGVLTLTAAVDVQKTRLVYGIRGWGAGGASWVIDFGVIWGQTTTLDPWAELTKLIRTPIDGRRIKLVLVDSGFRPGRPDMVPENRVYEWCAKNRDVARPAKGKLKLGKLAERRAVELNPLGKLDRYGLELVWISTDDAKQRVYTRVRTPHGISGALYLPEDLPEEYAAQLVSEARQVLPSGRPQWVRLNRENHALDVEAMNEAAVFVLSETRLKPGRDRPPAGSPSPLPSPAPAGAPPRARMSAAAALARLNMGPR